MSQFKLQRRQKGYLLVALLSVFSLTLLILPADYFDTGSPMCVSVLLLGKECYGCGMTRAVQHLIHFDFESAYHFNKLSFVVFPLLVGMILWELWSRFFKDTPPESPQ